MRHAHKGLVVPLPHAHFLLPERVLADAEHANAFGDEQINDSPTGRVQVPVYATGTPSSGALQTPTRPHLSQLALQLCATLVVELVDRLDWPPVDHARDEPRLVWS